MFRTQEKSSFTLMYVIDMEGEFARIDPEFDGLVEGPTVSPRREIHFGFVDSVDSRVL